VTPVRIPDTLQALLGGSRFAAETIRFVDAASEILADNKLPFFPAYTDHGCAHVQRVLDACVRLVPDDAWSAGLLEAADAAVLSCAAVLHDLALHLREPGFAALVTDATTHRPAVWFDARQDGRAPDVPWPALWQAFRKEARHVTQSQLDRLLGPAHRGIPAIAFGDPAPEPPDWTESDRILIGELLRRHHARLAHEIALHGLPGLDGDAFPRLAQTLPWLADAIGVVARSHGEPLRTAVAYLDYRHPGSLRPAGARLHYLMALLRIADYLQLDAERAPTLLLHLREPQSPQSLEEWHKHQAVAPIGWDHRDPLAFDVQVLAGHGLRTHLQLVELLDDFQRELDATTAVLSETYATPELAPLRLARQRVRSNIDAESLHAQLPYVPQRAALRNAEDLFRLVVGDLYGDEPAIAGRELLQNAVDAVRERRRWEAQHGAVADDRFHTQSEDVVVELRDDDDGYYLRVADRGIGMTPATVIDHFLAAGGSYSPSTARDEELDSATAVGWMKAGRFGVGAFAAFLLGGEIRVTTRHLGESRGVTFVARLDDDLVRLDWVDAPFGTEIVVPFSNDLAREVVDSRRWAEEESDESYYQLNVLASDIECYYVLPAPAVAFTVSYDAVERSWCSRGAVPDPFAPLPDAWRAIAPDGIERVLWKVDPTPLAKRWDQPIVAHNGIVVAELHPDEQKETGYSWAERIHCLLVHEPDIAVFDSAHRLGLSLHRYQLRDDALPFERELLEAVADDVVAHALVGGPRHHPLGNDVGLQPVYGAASWVPFHPTLIARHLGSELYVLWIEKDTDRRAAARFLAAKQPRLDWRSDEARIALEASEAVFGIRADELQLYFGGVLKGTLRVRTGQEPVLPSDAWGKTVTPDRATTRRLTAICEELGPYADRGMIGVTLLELPEPSDRAQDDPIVDRWERAVGPRGLERAARARQARAASIAAERPELAAAMRIWERTLAG